MQASQSMYNLSSISSPQYVPSHLRQSHRTPQAPRSSPPRIRRSSTTSRFGGPSFGTPKQSRSQRAHEKMMADAPPTESMYDFHGGSSFTSATQAVQSTSTGVSNSPKKSPATFASLPRAVIIFGFPSQMAARVLAHFSRFGQIEEQSASTAQVDKNWMKITYKDSSAAQSAVAANGTFVEGQFMVGCVFSQEEPLASVDADQEDAMDIDPQTPPRPKAATQNRANMYNTPMRLGQSNNVPSSTPGGKRIEVLSSDAIYKSTSPLTERAAAWLPSWTTDTNASNESQTAQGTSNGAQKPEEAGWPTKVFRGILDTIFGF